MGARSSSVDRSFTAPGMLSCRHPKTSSQVIWLPAHTGGPRSNDCLGPVRNLELGEDAGYMVAHRLGAEKQALCDVVVGHAGGDEVEHLTLPGAQLWKLLGVEGGQ